MSNPLITARDAFVAEHPEKQVQVNGRDWGVIRTGSAGPALILIPGTLGRADIFWQQISALLPSARILSLSYPGTGGIADWAEDIAALIDAEGMKGATLLGSSLGGYLAQYVAGKYTDRLGGLIAANTLPAVTGIDQMPPYRLDLQATPIDTLRAGFENGLKSWDTPGHPYADLAGLLLAEVAGRIPEDEMRARLQALKSAPQLPAQTLRPDRIFTIESDDDHLISAPVRTALRDTLKPARAFRFGVASHFPYVTRPDSYTALLREVMGLDKAGTTWPDQRESIL